MTHQTPLTVYKASAGSGKTFTLAVEYIKLLIEDPLSYRSILAVTFTNKATEEMKMRILSQLNGLAHGYEDSKDYMDKITRELGVSEEHLKVVVPLPKNMAEIKATIEQEINYHGVSVIIPRRECMQTLQRHLKQKKANK